MPPVWRVLGIQDQEGPREVHNLVTRIQRRDGRPVAPTPTPPTREAVVGLLALRNGKLLGELRKEEISANDEGVSCA